MATYPDPTPPQWPGPREDAAVSPDSGNTARCYICDLPLGKLDQKQHVRRHTRQYYDHRTERFRSYLLSLCVWCDYRFLPQ